MAKSSARVEINPRLQDQLNDDPQMRNALRAQARKVRDEAVKIAGEFERTGDYRRSIRVGEVDGRIVVESTDPFAHLVEYGSINNEAYAPLRRASENVARLREKRK